MEIGIIGTGNMGHALAEALSNAGHSIMIGSRDPQRGQNTAEQFGPTVSGGSNAEAAEFSDVIVLAIPFEGYEEVIDECGSLAGKTIIDVSNPVDFRNLQIQVGNETSGAEEIAGLAPDASVVKALNAIHAEVIVEPEFDDDRPPVFYCGDDEDAKSIVAELIEDCGLDAIDSGPLKAARYLEPMAGLLVQLSMMEDRGVDNAFFFFER